MKGSAKLTSSYIPKIDKVVTFDKIIQKTNDLVFFFNSNTSKTLKELKLFNLREENLPGKNLFFFIYGAKSN